MRVLITGSRRKVHPGCVQDALSRLPADTTVVVGDASGVDTHAKEAAERLGFAVDRFEADWDRYGRAAGPIRNQKMVDSGADLCIGFPDPNSRGTYDCMDRAAKAGIPVVTIKVNV